MAIDIELVRSKPFRIGLATEREKKSTGKLDPVDYRIYTTKIELMTDEAREIHARLGISEVIRAGDTAQGIHTGSGDLAVIELGTYLHGLCAVVCIKYVLKHYKDEPTVGVRDGDAFVMNETIYGGIHNADYLVVMPVFYKGELIAWTSSSAHEPDTGTTEPGGMPASAKTRFDEGLKVPPLKVAENFQMKRDVLELFENMVRYPLMISNDVTAKVTVCKRMRDQLIAICDKMGVDFVVGLLRKNVEDAEKWAREKISQMPDGIFRHVAFLDVIGTDTGLVRIPCAMHKKGDSIIFDFQNASPEFEGPFNTMPHAMLAHMGCVLFQYFLNDYRASSGALTPIDIKTTPGSFLDCNYTERAVSSGVLAGPLVGNCAHVCLCKAAFSVQTIREEAPVCAPIAAGTRNFFFGGRNQWGISIAAAVMASADSSAHGAIYNRDGLETAGIWWMGVGETSDCEWEEVQYPYVNFMRSFVTDGGGPGKYRGGTGLSVGVFIHGTSSLFVQNNGCGCAFPVSSGLFGGYAAPPRATIHMVNPNWKKFFNNPALPMPKNDVELLAGRAIDADYQFLPSSKPGGMLNEGDAIVVASQGGGGYGDVLDRDPELVVSDLKKGLVSPWAATNVCRVVYDEDTLLVDTAKTEGVRKAERKDRLARGKKYAVFEKEWLKKRPPEEALKYYGTWPVPQYK